MNVYNIYCDESCHLENDKQPIMALGAITCPYFETKRLSEKIFELKKIHHAQGELKWIKLSNSRKNFYFDLVNLFFDEPALQFRALVVLNKSTLNHNMFNQCSHDTFYYKMYFSLLNKMLNPDSKYNIYVDIKDTRSRFRNQQLRKILCNNVFDFTGEMIEKIQNIRSNESNLLQLTDLFLGALTYKHRYLNGNTAKLDVVNFIESKLKKPFTMLKPTPLNEQKFNLFLFQPQIHN